MGKKPLTLTVSSGETHTLAEWAAKTGIEPETIRFRIKSGKTPDEAVGIVPILRKWSEKNTLDVNGVVKSVGDWSKETGISASTIQKRINAGLSPAQCVGLEARPDLIEWEGGHYTFRELAHMHGLAPKSVSYRMKRGMSLKDALTRPVKSTSPKPWQPDPRLEAEMKWDWLENPDLSQYNVAQKYGVSPSTLIRYFGKRRVRKGVAAQTKADAKIDWLGSSELSEEDIATSKPEPSYTAPEVKEVRAGWIGDTKLEAEAKRDWLENHDLATAEIEAKYGVSRGALRNRFGRRPFFSPNPNRWKVDAKLKAAIEADWLGNLDLSNDEVAAKYGTSTGKLHYHFGKRGLPIGRPKRGLTIEERQLKQKQKRERDHFAWSPEDIDL